MPVMKFNFDQTPKKRDTARRDRAVAHGDHIQVVGQAFGDPVSGQVIANEIGENVEEAWRWSTAPYQPEGVHAYDPVPPRKKYKRPSDVEPLGQCTANDGTCQGFATHRWPGLCAAHGMAAEKEAQSSTSKD